MGLDWLFEHTNSEPDDTPHSNPGEFFYTFFFGHTVTGCYVVRAADSVVE
jgi:hypothetical protein